MVLRFLASNQLTAVLRVNKGTSVSLIVCFVFRGGVRAGLLQWGGQSSSWPSCSSIGCILSILMGTVLP